MISLFAECLALGADALLAPLIIAFMIVVLSRKDHALSLAAIFLAGNLLTLAFLTVAGLWVGGVFSSGPSPSDKSLYVIMGILFILFGIKCYFSKEQDTSHLTQNADGSPKYLLFFGLGFLSSITNIDAEAIFLVVMNDIIDSGLSKLDQFLFWILACLMFLLPVLLPLAIFLLFPKRAPAILQQISKPIKKHGKTIVTLIFIIFGIVLLLKGLNASV